MNTSTRILILAIAIELFLGAGMFYLMAAYGSASAETARRITAAIGAIMGTLGVFFAIWWYQLRKSGS